VSQKPSLVPSALLLLLFAAGTQSIAQKNTGSAPGGAIANAAQPETGTPPQIIMQPSSETVTAPAVATFSVFAESILPTTVQWFKNKVAIGGATDWTYTTVETTTADNDAKFTTVVTNSAGSTKSQAAVLTVKAPVISGTLPIVGEWSGTATIRSPGSSAFTSDVTIAFSQTSYSLTGTVVYTDDSGIPNYGVAIASLNGSNLFTVFGDDSDSTVSIAAGFSANTLTMTGSGAGGDGEGSGIFKISSDKKTLTGNGTDTLGDSITWKLTRDN
jgi:hypothetical protein